MISKKVAIKPYAIGSSFSFISQSIFKKIEKPFLIILNNKEEAAYYLNDFEKFVSITKSGIFETEKNKSILQKLLFWRK